MMPPSGRAPGEADGVGLPDDVTQALREACQGEGAGWDAVLAALYGKLREIAHREIRRHDGGHTLEPTALADEAWARLAHGAGAEWKDRTHFLSVAAIAMRAILVDTVRARRAQKRGGALDRITLTPGVAAAGAAGDPVDIIDLHEALTDLAARSSRQARIVELRFFGGLTVEEVAASLSLSVSTVEGEWRVARAWLSRRLERGGGP
jgi:RNA polymerase sigma-70 factor, ECF subfamily